MQRLASIWLERGPLARALWPLSLLYGLLWRMRLALYRSHRLRTTRLAVPVIVVGNLFAGGAGKTPTVIATLELLRGAGWTPGVLSRGYGRRHSDLRDVDAASDAREVGDEPLLIHLRTRAPVVVQSDRGAAGLAQPERFFAMLREAQMLVTPLPLPDHHHFATLPWPPGTADVLLTEKDAVKLRPSRLGEPAPGAARTRVWVVALDFEPDAGFGAALLQLLDQRRTDRGSPSA